MIEEDLETWVVVLVVYQSHVEGLGEQIRPPLHTERGGASLQASLARGSRLSSRDALRLRHGQSAATGERAELAEYEEVDYEDFPLQGPCAIYRDSRQLRHLGV